MRGIMGGKQPVLTLFCKQIDDKRLDSGYVVFNDVLDAWLSETRGRVKRSTLATYRGASERYVRPALGALPTEQMTDEQVAKFLREASEIYASSTLRIICHILRSAIELAHGSGLCGGVSGRFQLPHSTRHEARILSQEEQLRLLETLRPEDGPVQLGILLCLYTGMRLGEACGLRWGDFSPDCNIIYIRRTLQRLAVHDGEHKIPTYTGLSLSSAGFMPPFSYHGDKKARHPIGDTTLLYFLYIPATYPSPVRDSQSGYIVLAEHSTPALNTSSSSLPGP